MKKEKIKSFLGTGWSFPPTFDHENRSVQLLSEIEDINSSLEILLSTKLGERVMRPDYGCNLEDLIFESLDVATETFITELIRTAILYHEPRIDLEKVEYIKQNYNQGMLLINIDYTVRITNSRSNYVFPFYKEEANNL